MKYRKKDLLTILFLAVATFAALMYYKAPGTLVAVYVFSMWFLAGVIGYQAVKDSKKC